MNQNKGEDLFKFFQIKTTQNIEDKVLRLSQIRIKGRTFSYLKLSLLEKHKTFYHILKIRLSSSHKLQQGGPSHYFRSSQIRTTHTHRA
jgi:hypothetical protein